MRDYQYISDSKAEMLFPQIPPRFLEGVSAEIGFDFGLIKGKVGRAISPITSRVARVQAIEKYFSTEGALLAIPRAESWVSGEFEARAGFLPPCKGLVLFAGRFSGFTVLLAGSEANLISGSANAGSDRGWSFMPRILEGLETYITNNYEFLDIESNRPGLAADTAVIRIFGGRIDGAAETALLEMPGALPGPPRKLSFLSRVFLTHKNMDGDKLAIGSPLAVWA
jgi:hypothetical protein